VLKRALIGCECSGRVREAFAAREDWEVWSADFLPSEIRPRRSASPFSFAIALEENSEGKGHHYRGDVRDLFNWNHPVNVNRSYQERKTPVYQPPPPLWNLVILHPPCDDISYAGARWFKQKQADGRQQAGIRFFLEMLDAPAPFVCVENPHSIVQRPEYAGPPSQIVEPYWFGDPYRKGIHLWLKGLPHLTADNMTEPVGRVTTGGGSWRTDKKAERHAMSAYEDSEGRKNRAKVRSRTMPGLARAMAEQWVPVVEAHCNSLISPIPEEDPW
jgi:hypothetical protein